MIMHMVVAPEHTCVHIWGETGNLQIVISSPIDISCGPISQQLLIHNWCDEIGRRFEQLKVIISNVIDSQQTAKKKEKINKLK